MKASWGLTSYSSSLKFLPYSHGMCIEIKLGRGVEYLAVCNLKIGESHSTKYISAGCTHDEVDQTSAPI